MPVHDADQVQGAYQVVVVVVQRLPDRLTDGLEPGEMDDGVNGAAGKDVFDGVLVHQVNVVELGGLAAEFGNPPQRLFA